MDAWVDSRESNAGCPDIGGQGRQRDGRLSLSVPWILSPVDSCSSRRSTPWQCRAWSRALVRRRWPDGAIARLSQTTVYDTC